jgi:arylsulfatase A-like enzyme
MNSAHKSVILAALLLAPVAVLNGADSPSGKPNVIIVLTDDQGYGDLSGTGNPVLKTPHLDRLAAEGVNFANFHVDAYCAPTRAALMTGRYSHRVGGWGTINGRNMLRDEEVTMADVFRHNGYRTGHFGKWHLGSNYPYRPMDRGFDEWLGHGDGGTGCTTDYWGNDRVNDRYLHNGQWESKPRPGFECDVFFDAAMQFIRENKRQPFFTYLAPYNPHNPCSVPDQQWVAPYRGKVPNDVAYMFATVARVDENLGRLRQFLKDEGLADNTVLIFLTDNGTARGERVFNAGMRGKKGSPYEGGHRVPCFLHWPAGGLNQRVTVDRLAAHLDLLPTLVDLCALQLPKPIAFDGTSLKPLLANPRPPWPERTLVMGSPHNEKGPNPPPPKYGQGCAVMTDRWRWVNDQELHDLTNDPGQKREVAGLHPEVVNELRGAYQRYWASVSKHDEGWRGRPIIGSSHAPDVELCAEDWYSTQGNCPWNQAAVASGAAVFGRWPVRFAEAGTYLVEVRRWPREADAPLAGVPASGHVADAQLADRPVRELLYLPGGPIRALPVARVQLKVGSSVQEAAVESSDTCITFTTKVDAGPTDIEATLYDESGKALGSAFYVSVRKSPQTKQ